MKILVVCSAGMSTSLLVNKMIAASHARGRDDKIWAVGQSMLEKEIKKCDVLLLGPQVYFLQPKIEKLVKDAGKNMDVISSDLYSKVDGYGVLDLAINLVNN